MVPTMTLRTMTGCTGSVYYRPRSFPDGKPPKVSKPPPIPMTTSSSKIDKLESCLAGQKRVLGTIAASLGHEVEVRYAPSELDAFHEVATRYAAPILGAALVRLADAGVDMLCLSIRTTSFFDQLFTHIYGNDVVPKAALKALRVLVLQTVIKAAAPIGGGIRDWRRARVAAEFVCALGKYEVNGPVKQPVDAAWRLLAGSTCATTSSKATYRRVTWCGMIVRVAIEQTVIVGDWTAAKAAMDGHGDLRKEVVAQIKAMERNGAIGDKFLALAREAMELPPRKVRAVDGADNADGDGDDDDSGFDIDLDELEDLGNDVGVDVAHTPDPVSEPVSELAIADEFSFDELIAGLPEQETPPAKKVRQQEINSYFRVTKVSKLSRPVDFTAINQTTSGASSRRGKKRKPPTAGLPPAECASLLCTEKITDVQYNTIERNWSCKSDIRFNISGATETRVAFECPRTTPRKSIYDVTLSEAIAGV